MPAKTTEKPDSEHRRVLLPNDLLALIQEASIGMKVSAKTTLQLFLMEVANLANTQPELFGFHYANARKRMDGRGEFMQDDAVYQIDTARLHRSDKTKSGFVGVYSNGKGFNAQAKTSVAEPAQISLGTFPTAVQAAEARRIHYFKQGIPYGRLGEKIESYRNRPEGTFPPEFQRQVAIHDLAKEGTPAEGLTAEERVWETQDPYDHHPLSIKQAVK